MTEIKDRIAAIDEFGRGLAAKVNELIVAEDLKGQSPATIRRVEELIEGVLAADLAESHDIDRSKFDFAIMKGGLAAAPLVTVARFNGRVGGRHPRVTGPVAT